MVVTRQDNEMLEYGVEVIVEFHLLYEGRVRVVEVRQHVEHEPMHLLHLRPKVLLEIVSIFGWE